MRNKKAQIGPVSFLFMVVFVILIMAIAGYNFFGLWHEASAAGGLTGLEGFLFNNPEVFTIIALILGIVYFYYKGSA
jgi:hypothetical protein